MTRRPSNKSVRFYYYILPSLTWRKYGKKRKEGIKISAFQGVETQIIAFNNTNDKEATFEGGCDGFYLSATADVLVDFDQPTDAGSFLIKANIAYPFFEFRGVSVQKVHAMGSSGSGNLHIIGVR